MIRTLLTFLFAALGLVLVMPPLILYSLIVGNVHLMYRVFVRACHLTLRTAGIRVRAEGLENIPPGTCVFASNHCSNLDPVAFVTVAPKQIALIAKKEVFRIPILSKAIRMGGLIPIDRSSKEDAAAGVDQAIDSLKNGLSFCIFAEGTRSRDGRLQPFKRGAFVMAIRAQVPVVPVSLAGTQLLMRKGDWKLYPGEVVVTFGPAIDAARYSIHQRQQLTKQAHAAVASLLPPGQQPRTPA
jgi:1-acyl-sn-glycerol-3-phosphate acyltransferase